MEKIKRFIKRRRIIINIFIYVLIGAGLVLIAYPIYTNFIASRAESENLSAWEQQKQDPNIEETGSNPDGEISSTESIEQEDTEAREDEDDPVMDMGQNGFTITETESGLNAEDYFPLKMSIPKIELEYIVYEGADTVTLKKGPGHMTLTPLPGEEGRCTISGHRTTYGSPFNRVDEMEEGDIIYLETQDDRSYTYIVTGSEVVKPTDVYILEGTDKIELLLTTCHPKFSAVTRLIIIAELVELFPFELEAS